jgi:hypothetical protein
MRRLRRLGLWAAHHPTFDCILFDFYGGVSSGRQVSYVSEVFGDPSGLPVPVAGRAVLQVRFAEARGRANNGTVTAPDRSVFPLPNVLTAVKSGDHEGVLSYGIGLARRESVRVSTATNPPRIVIDSDTHADFPTVEPFFVPVMRPVMTSSPAHGLMDRLFAGPTANERANGLRFLASQATGCTGLSISTGAVTRVQMLGGCSSGGATVSPPARSCRR